MIKNKLKWNVRVPYDPMFKQNLLIEGVTYCKSLVIPVTEFISFYNISSKKLWNSSAHIVIPYLKTLQHRACIRHPDFCSCMCEDKTSINIHKPSSISAELCASKRLQKDILWLSVWITRTPIFLIEPSKIWNYKIKNPGLGKSGISIFGFFNQHIYSEGLHSVFWFSATHLTNDFLIQNIAWTHKLFETTQAVLGIPISLESSSLWACVFSECSHFFLSFN